MRFIKWCIKWWTRANQTSLSSRRHRGRPPGLWAHRAILRLEELETRTVPSNYLVTSAADPVKGAMPGTLRYGVNYLNRHGGGILEFSANIGNTITLAQ